MTTEAQLALKEQALDADYKARREGMIKMTAVAGIVVLLIVLAGAIAILILNNAVGNLTHNQVSGHSCALSVDKLLLQGIHVTQLPGDCVQ